MAIPTPFHVTVKDPTADPPRYYEVRLTLRDANRYNNGCMVSIGLTVGEGSFKASSLKRLQEAGRVKEIDQTTYNHSGCRSSCILRGGSKCRW